MIISNQTKGMHSQVGNKWMYNYNQLMCLNWLGLNVYLQDYHPRGTIVHPGVQYKTFFSSQSMEGPTWFGLGLGKHCLILVGKLPTEGRPLDKHQYRLVLLL